MATANTSPAVELIRARLAASGGALTWAEVMELALYAPGAGYYRRGVRRIGRGGDFYTSVSVGPVFGELLALWVGQVWRRAGSPASFAVIEQGAHDGTLAADVLRGLEPELQAAVEYIIVEPDEAHRAAQRRAVEAEFPGRLRQVSELAELAAIPEHAAFLCNELPDAMPVHRVRFEGGAWRELRVRLGEKGAFEWFADELSSPRLTEELARAGGPVPEGFVADINLAMLDWVRGLAATRFRGAALVLDYGHGAGERFAPERAGGSLRRYRAHAMDDRILEDLGDCDLTAHVDFARLAAVAEESGLELLEFVEQGRFLTRLFADSAGAASRLADAAWRRQFQSLTHPGILGRVFQALVLGKGLSLAGPGAAEQAAAARRRLGA